jgi:hypothetical protein
MAQIKHFNVTHLKKVQKMISTISVNENFKIEHIFIGSFCDLFQNFLPLYLKKSTDSYFVINEANEVKAFITIEKTKGNSKKWYIKRLFLDKNSFDEGKQLIGYVVAKYGALGADTFCVLIDENNSTLAELFSKRCGFRFCSREVLWQIPDDFLLNYQSKYSPSDFITFTNKKAQIVASLFNDAISTHFRFSLEKEIQEFKTYIPQKIEKYIILNNNKTLLCYFEIQKQANKDYIIDLILTKPFEEEYLPILSTIIKNIKEKNPYANIFIWNKNYLSCGKIYEQILTENNCSKTQSKMLFVKDFYKPLKNDVPIVNPAIIFNEISGKPAFIITERLQKSD